MSEMNKERNEVEVMENAVEAAAEAAQPVQEAEAVETNAVEEELAYLKQKNTELRQDVDSLEQENAKLRQAVETLEQTLKSKSNDNAVLFNRYFETLELNRDLSRRVLATLDK